MKGAWGEAAARGYLTRAGYRIVDCNFRTRFGEIDIIAQAGEYLVFIEVKTRKKRPLCHSTRGGHTPKAGAHPCRGREVAAGPSSCIAAAAF